MPETILVEKEGRRGGVQGRTELDERLANARRPAGDDRGGFGRLVAGALIGALSGSLAAKA